MAAGYFPKKHSVLRRVHGARIVGWVYGQRSLLLQAAHPLAFAGLIQSTSGQDAPFGRLAHTALTMEKVFFGSREEADRETRRVRLAHSRVEGRIAEATGPHPAGSAYRADDPAFLLWVLACLADSAETAYERFVRPLTRREREGFWRDYLLVGELFGLSRSDAPATHSDYRAYMAERLRSDDLYVTEEARELARHVAFELPLPATRRPALPIVNFAVLGLLPERIRELYRLPWSADRERAFEGLALALRAGAWAAPAWIRRGSCARDYRMVAEAERRRLAGVGA